MLSFVQKGLYIGDLVTVHQPATIWDRGIRAVLRMDRVQSYEWIDDFDVYKLPIEDPGDLTSRELLLGTAFIHRHLQQGNGVLLQCQYGTIRSTTMAVAYLIEYEDLTLGEALLRVMKSNQDMYPNRMMLWVLVKHYKLPYAYHDVLDTHFVDKVLLDTQERIDMVTDRLALGSVVSVFNQDAVHRAGISAVLRLDRLARSEGQWDEERFALLDMPIPDNRPLDKAMLERSTSFIHEQYTAGNTVLVHCQMGMSRSAAVMMAYLIQYHNYTLPQAYRAIRQARPIVQPNPPLVQTLVSHYDLPYDLTAAGEIEFLEGLL